MTESMIKAKKSFARWYLKELEKPEEKHKIVKHFGIKCYDHIVKIYNDRLEKDDVTIGPNGSDEWAHFMKQFKATPTPIYACRITKGTLRPI